MGNKKQILILVLAAILGLGVVGGAYYWAMRKSSDSTQASKNQPIDASQTVNKPTAEDIDKLPAVEQLAALTGTKTTPPVFTIPKVSKKTAVTKDALPKFLSNLIDADSTKLSMDSVIYSDNTTGYSIEYTLEKSFSSASLSYYFAVQNNGWKLVNTLKSAKAALFDLDNSGTKAHATILSSSDSEVTVKIFIIFKLN